MKTWWTIILLPAALLMGCATGKNKYVEPPLSQQPSPGTAALEGREAVDRAVREAESTPK